MKINIGNIKIKNKINIGTIKLGIKKVYPELENLEITPRAFEQKFNHPNSYGYDEITVNPIDIKLQNKEVTDDGVYTADSEYDGLGKVTVNTEETIMKKYLDTNIKDNPIGGVKAFIKKLPKIDISKASSLANFCDGFMSLKEAPDLDTSHIQSMYKMYNQCRELEGTVNIDGSSCTTMENIFNECYKIKKVIFNNTSNVTKFTYAFRQCRELESVEGIDTGNATILSQIFAGCNALTKLPYLDTKNVQIFSMAFHSLSIVDLQLLEAGNCNNMSETFTYLNYLKNFPGMHDLGKAYDTTKQANYGNYTFKLTSSTGLTHESLVSIINNLYDIKTKGCKTQSLYIGSRNLAKLTSEEINSATLKGWTVS